MVNPIAQIVITDKTCQGRSLQIMQLPEDYALRNHLKLLQGGNAIAKKIWLCQWLGILKDMNSYHKTLTYGTDSRNKLGDHSRRVNYQSQQSAKTRRDDWIYQRYTEPNQQNSSEDINVGVQVIQVNFR